MEPHVPTPDCAALLPPLLACLPTAPVSPQPPPALLQLLSPILRQRVQVLAGASNGSKESPWLLLLCWNPEAASKLLRTIESGCLEPHPVSGEVEMGEVKSPRYRRLDEETLQSSIEIPDLGLRAVYVWCESGPEQSTPQWQLFELRPLDDGIQTGPREWRASAKEASDVFQNSRLPRSTHYSSLLHSEWTTHDTTAQLGEDDDDDYWAQYDNTPGETPANYESLPSAGNASQSMISKRDPADDYFERYRHVQPEMDDDDTSADRTHLGPSTLAGNELLNQNHTGPRFDISRDLQPHYTGGDGLATESMIHTRPSSSSSSQVVAHLENFAETQSNMEMSSIIIQQHISTSMKSLFRLARGAGISRPEFKRLIRTELEVLGMLEDD